MTTYTAAERAAAMRRAGFPESSIVQGTAISLAELGEKSDTRTVIGDSGTSVGVWQIHLPAHPDVTSACAMDLDCSTQAALRISNGGTNWNPWGAFTNGSFQRYLEYARQAAGGGASGSGSPAPSPAPTPSSGSNTLDPGTASSGSTGSPLTDFQFPKLDLGILGSIGGNVLFKLALTLMAVALIFVGILQLTGLGEVVGKVKP